MLKCDVRADTGTQPVGGTPPYTFEWQSSTTSETAGFTTAPGTFNLQYYTPPALLTQTTWFRRVVRDNGAAITDVSLPVRIIVHPFIKNNAIGNPDTLCYGQNPPALNSSVGTAGWKRVLYIFVGIEYR